MLSGAANIKSLRLEKEISDFEKAERRKLQLQDMTAKERLKREAQLEDTLAAKRAKAQESQKKAALASLWLDTAAGIGSMWLSVWRDPTIPSSIAKGVIGGTFTAMMLANAGIQTATINKYANGGIVDGNQYSGDVRTARVNSGEMILNKAQQAMLFDMANNGTSNRGGSSSISVSIERFSGSDDDISKLEDMLIELQSNSRLSFLRG